MDRPQGPEFLGPDDIYEPLHTQVLALIEANASEQDLVNKAKHLARNARDLVAQSTAIPILMLQDIQLLLDEVSDRGQYEDMVQVQALVEEAKALCSRDAREQCRVMLIEIDRSLDHLMG
jgi:hypothetical protein